MIDALDLRVDWRIRLAGAMPRLVGVGKSGAVVVHCSGMTMQQFS